MSTVTNYLIPLVNSPQEFGINLAGVNYTMTNKWNPSQDAGWVLDLSDANGNAIAQNIPLITGADLLDGLQYLGIGGSLFVQTTGSNPDDVPTLDNLGVDSFLYFQVVTE